METVIQENACGGKGAIKLEKLLTPEDMKGKCALYARVTVPPGSSVGYHTHIGDSESYFILSGEGVYDDNGVKRTVKAGDATWTPDGSGHALSNEDGTQDVVFMALIVNS